MDVRSRATTSGRALGWALATAGALAFAGCKAKAKAKACEPALVDRAVTFLRAHQSCAVDDDCVVFDDFCGTLRSPHQSGLLIVNHEGYGADEWADLTRALESCSPDRCTALETGLEVHCFHGSCGGPYP